MKSLLSALIASILLLILPNSLLYSQVENFEFVLYFEDSVGNRDSVILGFNFAATVGIDPLLGEENIIATEYAEGLDVRITDEWQRRPQAVGTFHTKKQLVNVPEYVIGIDINSTNFPVTAYWEKEQFTNEQLNGTLLTSIHPGGWWDTGSPSNMGLVLLAQSDSVTFSSNAPPPVNHNYGFVINSDTISFHWFAMGSQGIGVDASIIDETSVKIYPNPVTHKVLIDVPETERHRIQGIDLYDTFGMLLMTVAADHNTEIDMSSFPPGTYVVRIRGESFTRTELVVKI